MSFTAPQELIKCLPSFDIVLCLLTLLTKEVPGTGLHLAAAQWEMLLALLGPPWVSVRLTVARPLLISTVLMGKECFKSQPKHVSLGTCNKQSFLLLLRRGKACTVPVQTRQHLQALPCLLSHLICGQGDNSARPFSFSATQLNASCLVATHLLQPWAKPCWNPRETCCWSCGSPELRLKQPHPPKNTFPSTMRMPCLRFVFSWSHLFPITVPVITLPQTLSLPLTSMPCLIPPEMLSAGMMSSWAPCITADAVGLTNERASTSPAGSALLGNRRERLTGSQIAGAGGSWFPLPCVALGTGRCRERTHMLHCPGLAKSLCLPGWSQRCPTHCYTTSWHICKGTQCFLLGGLLGFISTLACTSRIKKCAWHGCPKPALAENAARQWERKHHLKNNQVCP